MATLSRAKVIQGSRQPGLSAEADACTRRKLFGPVCYGLQSKMHQQARGLMMPAMPHSDDQSGDRADVLIHKTCLRHRPCCCSKSSVAILMLQGRPQNAVGLHQPTS